MKNILTLLILCIGIQSFAQKNCEAFKIGTFQNIEDGVLMATIERNETIQIEQYGTIKVKLKIEWIDECSYRLKFIEGNEAFWDTRKPDVPTSDMIVTITETRENSYIQESRFVDNEEIIYKSEIEKMD